MEFGNPWQLSYMQNWFNEEIAVLWVGDIELRRGLSSCDETTWVTMKSPLASLPTPVRLPPRRCIPLSGVIYRVFV